MTWQLTLDLESPDLALALERGLAATHDLRERGHGPATQIGGGFPAARLAQVMKEPGRRYSRAEFDGSLPDDARSSAKAGARLTAYPWSLLIDSQRCRQIEPGEPAYQLGRLVLLNGPIALFDLPHLRVGALLAVNRDEIESLRTLDQLIRQYRDHDKGKVPLSIGVFGPPGAGKSFGVGEIAQSVYGEKAWLEFNLSQFNEAEDLIGAFHQVRDRVLSRGDRGGVLG